MLERNIFQGPIQHGEKPPVITPCTFDGLQAQLGEVEQGNKWLYRDNEVHRQYLTYIDRLSKEGRTVIEYISAQHKEMEDCPFLLVENPYPYAVCAKHYVLFCFDPEAPLDCAEEHLQAWLGNQNIPKENVIVFENQYWIRSSTHLIHWHVMVRR